MAKNGNIHPTRIFKTPDDLYKAFEEYKEDLKIQSNEWKKYQYVSNGERKEDAQKLPLTIEGFKRFCYSHYGCIEQYLTNQDGLYTDFIGISTRIREEIRENQIMGGMLGFFNPSITARLNNLVDRKDVKSDDKPIGDSKVVLPEGVNLDEYLKSKGLD